MIDIFMRMSPDEAFLIAWVASPIVWWAARRVGKDLRKWIDGLRSSASEGEHK
ncbi:hypothetical protein [Burkholderia ubonensis]|uniref:hypothetical protein n=1 Tax=Burkholderia ubonensis TaxID=101571 RepID=UPI0012FA35C2|nr:hypothetical protein [Burkholderia ubonensis]